MNIERMRTAVAYWLTIPEYEWNMDLYYFTPNRCGCALGHLAHNRVCGFEMHNHIPTFDMGDGYPPITGLPTGVEAFDLTWNDVNFLFGRVGNASVNRVQELGQPTHKQIFFSRLKQLLIQKNIDFDDIFGPDEFNPGEDHAGDDAKHFNPGQPDKVRDHATLAYDAWLVENEQHEFA